MKRATTTRCATLATMLAIAAATVQPAVSSANPLVGGALSEAADAITAMEIEHAHTLLAPLDPSRPEVALQLGRLAMESGDCDAAVKAFSPGPVQALPDVGAMLVVATGCARAMAGALVVEDTAHNVTVRLQDDSDRALVPIIGETIQKQRDTLERELGVTMPTPTRVDVVRDQFSLAAMTGLPHSAAQTTGTVAIAKFGRVIMVSPRASESGFGWRDTIAHEFTHLALTRGTLDQAPLWLQEGVAVREQTRWREPWPHDEALPADAIAAIGFNKGLSRPLDGIGPSIALLPSAQQAMVVYAEVTSFVRFIAGDRASVPGAATDATGLPKLVKALARGIGIDAALREATGHDLKEWNGIWQPWVATQTQKLPASLGLDDAQPKGPKAKGSRQDMEATRIGELLLGRDHPKEARAKLDPLVEKIAAGGDDDPLLYADAALARLRSGDAEGAKKLVDPPSLVHSDFGRWWAVRAEVLAALSSDPALVLTSLTLAIANDPLASMPACAWADAVTATPALEFVARALCVSARARATPAVGRD